MTEVTGKIDFTYRGDTYQTWYKVVGDLKSGVRPLIALHGGPGVSHDYMIPHADLYASLGIPVIFYDQVGGGASTHLKDKGKEFFIVDLFMDELDNLLKFLGISHAFDLVGHSWGGMLAVNYAAVRKPAGLKHLILTATPASMALWEKSTAGLVDALPVDLKDAVRKHEKEGTTDAKEYQDAMMIFYQKHLCRLSAWPEELTKSLGAMEEDPTVYHTMQGPSEFTITGTLKTWSVVDLLHTVTYPTLLINSVFDEAQDVCVLPFFLKMPKIRWVQFANSSHMPFFEERERYIKVVGEFLTNV